MASGSVTVLPNTPSSVGLIALYEFNETERSIVPHDARASCLSCVCGREPFAARRITLCQVEQADEAQEEESFARTRSAGATDSSDSRATGDVRSRKSRYRGHLQARYEAGDRDSAFSQLVALTGIPYAGHRLRGGCRVRSSEDRRAGDSSRPAQPSARRAARGVGRAQL